MGITCGEGNVIEVGVGGVDVRCKDGNVPGQGAVCTKEGERRPEDTGGRYNGVDNPGVNHVPGTCSSSDDEARVRAANDDMDEEVGDGVSSTLRGWTWCWSNCAFC